MLLGSPVAHSLSPRFQNAALRHLGVGLSYEAVDVAPERLAATLDELRRARGAGNVTVPHKIDAARLCDELTPLARRVGAVNTFWVRDDGRLVGDNTDVGGFDAMARSIVRVRPRLAVTVLGAGGAAAAVLAALESWPEARVTLWNRSPSRARELAERWPVVRLVVPDVADAVRGADVVVNATTVGMRGDALPAPLDAFATSTVVLDLVYRPGGTAWVRLAHDRGHSATDGLPMLIEQGALAFERWLGVPAPRDVMHAAVDGVG